MRYRKKPVVVEAFQYAGRWEDVSEWLTGLPAGSVTTSLIRYPDGSLHIHTLEGTMRVDVGDWIICGVRGELYPCKPDVFEATYEPEEER